MGNLIHQYTVYGGKYLQSFKSTKDVSTYYNVDVSSVRKALCNPDVVCANFKWSYEAPEDICLVNTAEEFTKFNKYKVSFKAKPVHQFTMDGVYVQSYPSAIVANELFGMSVINSCLGSYYSTGGYLWDYNVEEYYDGELHWVFGQEDMKPNTKAVAVRYNSKAVHAYTVDKTKYIGSFRSVRSAAKYVNADKSSIQRVLNKGGKSCKGYWWTYKSPKDNVVFLGEGNGKNS
jgi:hypothetical protein